MQDSTTGRHGSYGQLALAFVNSRTPAGRQYSGQGTSRRSMDSSAFTGSRALLEHHNSQDLVGTVTPSIEQAAGFTPPSREMSGTGTPFAPNNQDPGIPNIAGATYEEDKARYQSGITVSSAQRHDQTEQETPPNWSSPAAHQQRDLARLLGQSSARLLEVPRAREDEEEEKEKEEERTRPPGPESERTVRTGEQAAFERDSSPPRDPMGQAIPHDVERAASPLTIPPESTDIPVPSQPPQRPLADGPQQTTPHTSLPYRENNPPAFKASLPQVTEDVNETSNSIFTNTQPFENSTESPRARTTFAAREGPIQRVTGGSVSRDRVGSETSDEMQRYDVSAREREEATRMRKVWEQKGYLTAPKQSPHEVRRRVKAM